MNLTNKTALVTGAAKGIGRAIACKMARHGAFVIIHYNGSSEAASETLHTIREDGGTGAIVQADFGHTESVRQMFAQQLPAVLEERRLDILVNNAGVCERSYLQSFTDEQFEKTMTINFRTPMYVIREALKVFNPGGKIINISSMMTKDPDSKYILYGASKAALNTLTAALAPELGKRGITINSLMPGLIPTNIREGFNHPMVTEFITKRTALRRPGTVEDVADIAWFLASPESGWITGQLIEATGGFK